VGLVAILRCAGGAVSLYAGYYLLTRNSLALPGAEGGQSWFEALAHGIGIYFLARGAWMLGGALELLVEHRNEAISAKGSHDEE
jgi:hypothetical protein